MRMAMQHFVAVAWLACPIAAQIPAHAVRLNPTSALIQERVIAIPSFPCGLAVDGDHVHAVVESGTVGPLVASSHDGGTTWSSPGS